MILNLQNIILLWTTILLIPVEYVTYIPNYVLIPTLQYMYNNMIKYGNIFNNDILPYFPCFSPSSYENCVNIYLFINEKTYPIIIYIYNNIPSFEMVYEFISVINKTIHPTIIYIYNNIPSFSVVYEFISIKFSKTIVPLVCDNIIPVVRLMCHTITKIFIHFLRVYFKSYNEKSLLIFFVLFISMLFILFNLFNLFILCRKKIFERN